MPNDERNLETLPDGALGLIPLESCKELGLKVDKYLVGWREKRQHQHASDLAFKDYRRDSYIISTAVPRFGTGEAKGVIKVSKPFNGIAFCTRGSCASNVMMLSTPIAVSSCNAKAQSKDSREVRLC